MQNSLGLGLIAPVSEAFAQATLSPVCNAVCKHGLEPLCPLLERTFSVPSARHLGISSVKGTSASRRKHVTPITRRRILILVIESSFFGDFELDAGGTACELAARWDPCRKPTGSPLFSGTLPHFVHRKSGVGADPPRRANCRSRELLELGLAFPGCDGSGLACFWGARAVVISRAQRALTRPRRRTSSSSSAPSSTCTRASSRPTSPSSTPSRRRRRARR